MNGYLVQRILKKGARSRYRFFDIIVSNASLFTYTTVICSKKISKKAVVRNRLKRQMREFVRHCRQNGLFSGKHVVIVLKKESIGASFQDFLALNVKDIS